MAKKLLFTSGSIRKGSFNTKLATLAYHMAKEQGADATYVDLREYPMPIYDGDLEEASGLPETATALKALFVKQDGFFISSPEYNSSFSPLLKNSLDWISRKGKATDEEALIAFKGKTAAISAASPGGFGGLRGLVPLRMMLGNIGVHVIPSQLAVASATDAFNDDGTFKNKTHTSTLKDIVAALIERA